MRSMRPYNTYVEVEAIKEQVKFCKISEDFNVDKSREIGKRERERERERDRERERERWSYDLRLCVRVFWYNHGSAHKREGSEMKE